MELSCPPGIGVKALLAIKPTEGNLLAAKRSRGVGGQYPITSPIDAPLIEQEDEDA
jgi:hypothetical protein